MNLPEHVGIILDGNRRWARKRNLPTFAGHKKGFEKLKKIISYAQKKGIKYLTLYCLSIKNLERTKKEVKYLFNLLNKGLKKMDKIDNIKCKVLGRIKLLPEKLQESIKELEEKTKKNDGMLVNFCIAYDGQAEIVDSVKRIVKKNVSPEKIDEIFVKKNMDSKESPGIDLIVRTGMKKARRLSGFMLWDSSYAEFKFRKEYWPDYNKEMFEQDLKEYSERHRRFGK